MLDLSKIKGLTADSRKVEEGFLFVALPGSAVDGRDYIAQAIDKGATNILTLEGTEEIEGVEFTFDGNPRKRLAQLAAEFYGAQPETIAAVTGTNGKTSVVSFTEQLWAAAGYKSTSLGTLKGNLTTPDAVALHENLANQAEGGITHLALEASSHGLDQYRLDGVKVKAAGFTNLTRDHLDYHGDMDTYFRAKARLFAELLPEDGVAVLNADDPVFEHLNDICEERGLITISYGFAGKDLKILELKPTAHGQEMTFAVFGHKKTILLPLVGQFQAMNALCALGLALAQDTENKAVYIEALENIKGAHGRLERVSGHPRASIYVDYAHTPDALENVLNALRPHTQGKLVCLFGCGGDRDKGKRPQMGEVATKLADTVIITDDNPRSEDPSAIRAEILKAAPAALEIEGRRKAIKTAIANLAAGDLLVIAGKGHETGQIFADHVEPFDDVEEAKYAIQSNIEKG